MNIIGICGAADSGKGTVGKILNENYGFRNESFAGPVKDCCFATFGWSRHLLEGDTTVSRVFRETKDEYWSLKLGYDVTPRLMMQKMGTEAVRDGIDNDIWLLSLLNRVTNSPYNNWVITDTRFPNEIQFVKDNGGKVILVMREKKPWWDAALFDNNNPHEAFRMSKEFPDIHISEWAWIGQSFDYIIENNGTLEDLEKTVDKLIHMI